MDTEPIISPKAFVRTYSPIGYDDPWELVEDYFTLVEFAAENPDVTPYKTAQLLGLSVDRTRNWYEGAKPSAVKALEVVDALGWDETPWDSPTGRAFNIFAAAIYGSGTLGNDFHPAIMLTDDVDDEGQVALEAVVRTLVGSVEIALKDDENRPPVLKPGDHGPILGRALYVLGVPKGPKTAPGYSLPEYLDHVSESLRREFVEVYVLLRAYHPSANSRRMDIKEERSPEYLESLAALIADVTGEEPTVRTNGIYLSVGLVDNLSLQIDFPPEESA